MALRRRANRRNVTYLSLILLLIFGGMGAIIALDLRTGYPFSARQLVIFSPYSVLAIATACFQFFQSRRVPHLSQYAGTLLITICFLVWIGPLSVLYFPLKVDFRGAARYLFQHVESHDVLISPVQEYFAYYYPELDARSVPSIPTNEADMDKLVRSHRNVWIVLFQSALVTPPPFLVKWINDHGVKEVSIGQRNADFRVYVYGTSEGSEARLSHTCSDRENECHGDWRYRMSLLTSTAHQFPC
jgi:hypothetical protein